MSSVTFLLPGRGTIPVGGFKVVYEYANNLARRGWLVRVVHPYLLSPEEIELTRSSFLKRTRRGLGYNRLRLTGNYRPDKWFNLCPSVELLCTKTPDARLMPPSDAWVATFWSTAKWVGTYTGAKLYLIQHLETWAGPETDVLATWKLPLQKVVISQWLAEVAASLGETAHYIPNGLNFETFGLDVAPEAREPHIVAMLYHTSKWKGSADGIHALCQAKTRVPALQALVFGVYPRPSELPDWIEYYQNPPQHKLREIYNRAAVFMSPSWSEGWPLPPAEALQCGAALAATDIGGHREYARHGETALLSPAKNPEALTANLLRLLEDQELKNPTGSSGTRERSPVYVGAGGVELRGGAPKCSRRLRSPCLIPASFVIPRGRAFRSSAPSMAGARRASGGQQTFSLAYCREPSGLYARTTRSAALGHDLALALPGRIVERITRVQVRTLTDNFSSLFALLGLRMMSRAIRSPATAFRRRWTRRPLMRQPLQGPSLSSTARRG